MATDIVKSARTAIGNAQERAAAADAALAAEPVQPVVSIADPIQSIRKGFAAAQDRAAQQTDQGMFGTAVLPDRTPEEIAASGPVKVTNTAATGTAPPPGMAAEQSAELAHRNALTKQGYDQTQIDTQMPAWRNSQTKAAAAPATAPTQPMNSGNTGPIVPTPAGYQQDSYSVDANGNPSYKKIEPVDPTLAAGATDVETQYNKLNAGVPSNPFTFMAGMAGANKQLNLNQAAKEIAGHKDIAKMTREGQMDVAKLTAASHEKVAGITTEGSYRTAMAKQAADTEEKIFGKAAITPEIAIKAREALALDADYSKMKKEAAKISDPTKRKAADAAVAAYEEQYMNKLSMPALKAGVSMLKS